MPFYCYLCPNCLDESEQYRTVDERDTAHCHHCNARLVRKIVPFVPHFKGPGFYVNDSKLPGSSS